MPGVKEEQKVYVPMAQRVKTWNVLEAAIFRQVPGSIAGNDKHVKGRNWLP